MMKETKHDIGRAFVLVFGSLVVAPAAFAYYVLVNELREQNVCHVGPLSVQTNSHNDPQKFQLQRLQLLALYGTYTTFDDASYYFVKTPYIISPYFLPKYGYWSISNLSLTLLSPFLRRKRQQLWNDGLNKYQIHTAPAIQWDQSHEIQSFPENVHSSKSNRWCLHNRQDPKMYHQKGEDVESFSTETVSTILGDELSEHQNSSLPHFRICAPPQPSILSSGDQPPYFIELPLHPPMTGRWKKMESDSKQIEQINDDDNEGSYGRYRRSRRPANPYQLQVQCHVRDMDLHHLAHGSLQPNSKPNLGWEHAETIVLPVWNLFYLPGTLLLILSLLLIHLRERPRKSRSRHSLSIRQRLDEADVEEWNFLTAIQQQSFHETWTSLGLTAICIYVMGTILEPLVGAIMYISISMLFLQLLVVVSKDSIFLWLCFGQSILVAQLQPSIFIGHVELSSITLGNSNISLRLTIFCVLMALIPTLATSTEIPWKQSIVCVVVGWALSHPTILELFCAPQWTIPFMLFMHLLLKSAKLGQDCKKEDDETIHFFEDIEEEDVSDYETASEFTFSSTKAAIVIGMKEYICHIVSIILTYIFVLSWIVLTFGCVLTMDWGLVLGNALTIILCVICNKFTGNPLWSLYHMAASSITIMLNTMTLVGWYLCHVAISTRTLYALPSRFVFTSMLLQITAHFLALLYTTSSKRWKVSRVPGYYFWSQLDLMADEIRGLYRIVC
jgi:hypothetical protein